MVERKNLILGGAQIGQDYGVVRNTTFAEGQGIQELLDLAFSAGFTAIDTARTYGHSEEILGAHSWMGKIHTKLDEFDDPLRSLSQSLESLGRESVDLVYVCHDASRISNTTYQHWKTKFENLRERCLSLGAAVYSDQVEFPMLDFTEIETIQVPFNILTPSIVREKIKQWKTLDKKVNVRSVFAQGLLVEPTGDGARSSFAPSVRAFHEVARTLEMEPSELAFRWALSYPDFDGVILGISRIKELGSVSRWFGLGPLPETIFLYVEDQLEPFRLDIDLRKI